MWYWHGFICYKSFMPRFSQLNFKQSYLLRSIGCVHPGITRSKGTLHKKQIRYLGVIRGVQNFTPVLKMHTPGASGCMNFQHRCKILYTPDYTKITNNPLGKQNKKNHNTVLCLLLFCLSSSCVLCAQWIVHYCFFIQFFFNSLQLEFDMKCVLQLLWLIVCIIRNVYRRAHVLFTLFVFVCRRAHVLFTLFVFVCV